MRSVLGLSGVDPKTTKSSSGISSKAHRATVSLHQRNPACPEHSNSSNVSSHHHRQLRDDGSLKIIMLLGLSLTLLLLPWVSHHPEFLLAPFVLAVMPVVGNGVRPVLKELAAGFVTTLRLMGMAAWFDITHELPHQHNHHHNHLSNGHQHSSSSPGASGQQQQQAQQYGREMYSQQQPSQQAYSYQHVQHPQPRPSGPHSPWPNPAYMPANWPSQQQAGQPPAAAVGVSNPGLMSPISEDADVDWAPSSPPDPHRGDPNSLQHLRQVLAADLQTEAELGQQRSRASSNAAAGSGSGAAQGGDRRSPQQQRSPAGSPLNGNSPNASVASLDSADFPMPAAPPPQQQQVAKQQQQSSRDPRVLSKEAKQQLYRDHHNHLHQQQNGGGSSS